MWNDSSREREREKIILSNNSILSVWYVNYVGKFNALSHQKSYESLNTLEVVLVKML